MTTDRDPGFYWVRRRIHDDWIVAQWFGPEWCGWFIAGNDEQVDESLFAEIGSRIIPPTDGSMAPPIPEQRKNPGEALREIGVKPRG